VSTLLGSYPTGSILSALLLPNAIIENDGIIKKEAEKEEEGAGSAISSNKCHLIMLIVICVILWIFSVRALVIFTYMDILIR